jgi:hypothetical protein
MAQARDIGKAIGIESPEGVERLASAMRDGVTAPDGRRVSGAQVTQGLRRSAPLLRTIARNHGGGEQAAAAFGRPSFADLAVHVAAASDVTASASRAPNDVLGQEMAGWLQQPPSKISPAWDRMTGFDLAAGAFLSRVTGANPEREPLWARTMQSARKAFGDEYVHDLLRRAADYRWDERALMGEVDRVRRDGPDGNSLAVPPYHLYRFWDSTTTSHEGKKTT